jgi:hypothetical protein
LTFDTVSKRFVEFRAICRPTTLVPNRETKLKIGTFAETKLVLIDNDQEQARRLQKQTNEQYRNRNGEHKQRNANDTCLASHENVGRVLPTDTNQTNATSTITQTKRNIAKMIVLYAEAVCSTCESSRRPDGQPPMSSTSTRPFGALSTYVRSNGVCVLAHSRRRAAHRKRQTRYVPRASIARRRCPTRSRSLRPSSGSRRSVCKAKTKSCVSTNIERTNETHEQAKRGGWHVFDKRLAQRYTTHK